MKMTSRYDIEKQKGKMDADGFYILEEGGFYDPNGYYFNKKGFDANGGSYDEDGVYIHGIVEAVFTISTFLNSVSREKMKKMFPGGYYDDDDFFIL